MRWGLGVTFLTLNAEDRNNRFFKFEVTYFFTDIIMS